MAKGDANRLGFTTWVSLHSWLQPKAQVEFAHRLMEYLKANGLRIRGTPERAVIWSDQGSLSSTDQVNLLICLLVDAAVNTVSLSPLHGQLEPPTPREACTIDAAASDLALIGLTLLYRCQRIDADTFLLILSGAVRPKAAARSGS